MSKKVLITGGAGFIGFHLAKSLSDQEYKVTTLDNLSTIKNRSYLEDLAGRSNVEVIEGDITDLRTFETIGKDFDYIYHLAAINGTENFYSIPDQVLRVGTIGTLNVIDWFVEQGGGKLLFSSSPEVYSGALGIMGDSFPVPTPENVPLVIDDPTNVRWSYAAGKIVGEVAMFSYEKTHDMDFSIVRYPNVYGPGMGFNQVVPIFIKKILKRELPLEIFGGQETRSFCYVDDGVKATRLVMESSETNRQTVNIGVEDGEIKIIDLAEKLFNIVGLDSEIDIKPSEKGSVMRRCPDLTKLLNLGFSSEVSLDEGLRRTYDWYKDRI